MSDLLPMPENANRGWSERDDDVLRSEYRKGRVRYIANTLGRSHRAVVIRAGHLGLATKSRRIAPRPKPQPLANPTLVVELAEARMEADALRILLAMKCDMLSEMEAGWALGLSIHPPGRATVYSQTGRITSPLVMHAVTQAAIGMDLASKRLGRGGVLEGSGGSNRFVRRSGGER